MAKENEKNIDSKNKKNGGESTRRRNKEVEYGKHITSETKYTIYAMLAYVVAVIFVFAFFGGGGRAGVAIYTAGKYLFGYGYILLPALAVMMGASFYKTETPEFGIVRSVSGLIFLLSALGLIDIATSATHHGGIIGKIFALPFVALFDSVLSTIILGAVLVMSLIVLFDTRPSISSIKNFFVNLFSKHISTDLEKLKVTSGGEKIEIKAEKANTEQPNIPEEAPKKVRKINSDEEFDLTPKALKSIHGTTYVPPPLNLLAGDKGKPDVGDIKENANIIKRTLANFGILVEMDEVTIGPTVTRYALKPAQGVRLAKIASLQNDLALALAARTVRIEAPIPGKSLVGIEVPNHAKSTVGLGSLLSDINFQNSPKPLTVALGRSISGKSIYADMAKMPHVLIAGTTGSGKSVTIHSVITSLLYRNGPDDLRLIMVDPKRVELTLYNKIPHLLTPVITEPKKAILSLKWAAKEMERRYNVLEQHAVRDIASYHENIYNSKVKNSEDGPERMPYIVIIIDELADIMSSYPRELEAAIVRLAQMSRAIGIHLLLSTQRPSVNVITGLIKANIPSRVALQVSSQIDSRTILDQSGAEKLLGAGDMLYLSTSSPTPERLQSAYISEEEVKDVVKYLANSYKNEIPSDDITLTTGTISADKSIFEANLDSVDDADDDLYEDARATVISTRKASTSYLQRKLGVGYSRAARLIDMLEERGVVGPAAGSKPREVLEGNTETMADDLLGSSNEEDLSENEI